MALANSTGYTVVGGTCPTVGIAGGFSLGGGHSILSSSYGVGSDNVLEWEVVTPDGSHLIATPNQNSDLYWAMSGGGGSTFGVALSMTARLNPGGRFGGAVLSFNDSAVGNDAYWEAVGAFHALLPSFLDAGNSFTYAVGNTSLTAYGTMPGADLDHVKALLKPFQDDLTKRGIDAQFTPNVEQNYYNHFYEYLGPAPLGNCVFQPFTNSRLFPRDMVTDPKQNTIVTELFRNVSNMQAFSPFYCDSFNASYQAHSDNALSPAWRDAIFLCAPAGNFDWDAPHEEMAALNDYSANVLQPMLDAATPGGGVYLNEANYLYKDWKKEFYGVNYDRLLAVKKRYDPESLLYARTAVGSDEWTEDANGRLCRV